MLCVISCRGAEHAERITGFVASNAFIVGAASAANCSLCSTWNSRLKPLLQDNNNLCVLCASAVDQLINDVFAVTMLITVFPDLLLGRLHTLLFFFFADITDIAFLVAFPELGACLDGCQVLSGFLAPLLHFFHG